MRPIGKIRIKLATLLNKLGLEVQPEDFWMQEGGHRHRFWDLARWGADWKQFDPQYNVMVFHSIYCWDRMTECCRKGIVISHNINDNAHQFEISVKD